MKRPLFATAVAAAVCTIVSVPAVAGDYTQLALAAGIRGVDVAAMSLDEIAARKFSQESDDNQQAYVPRASVGDVAGAAVQSSRTPEGLSLDEVHLNMINAGVSGEERQLRVQPGTTSDLQARLRLAASAGIPAAEAEGMSLSAIAAHKFNGDVRGDDRARIR